jgi:hypothetical protein
MYVQCNIEQYTCNQCCCGKAVSITQMEYVFAALGVQHVMNMRHIVFC